MTGRAPRLFGTVAGILRESDDLAPLVLQLERLRVLQQELDQILRRSFGEADGRVTDAARHCRVTSLRHGTVTIRVSQNAFAARLKLMIPALLRTFQNTSGDVKAVKLEVQFLTAPPNGTGRSQRSVLAPPAAPLRALAQSLPDTPLRAAIESLAKKGR